MNLHLFSMRTTELIKGCWSGELGDFIGTITITVVVPVESQSSPVIIIITKDTLQATNQHQTRNVTVYSEILIYSRLVGLLFFFKLNYIHLYIPVWIPHQNSALAFQPPQHLHLQ